MDELVRVVELPGGPDDGHTFQFTWSSRGSYKSFSEQHHTDSDWFGDSVTIRVRGWSLNAALQKFMDAPLWVKTGQGFDWCHVCRQGIEGRPSKEALYEGYPCRVHEECE